MCVWVITIYLFRVVGIIILFNFAIIYLFIIDLKKKKKMYVFVIIRYGGNTLYTMGIGLLDDASALIYVYL